MILVGDCRDVMARLPGGSVSALVTDPPYGLAEYRAEEVAAMLGAWIAGEPYHKGGRGFMGKAWDSAVPGPDVWREAFRVMRPGACGLVFAGSRTVDLMGIALRLAGFEIRDGLQWLYGSGFPKSADVSKAIDALTTGHSPEASAWDGWGTALKPAHEPILMIRKPLAGTVAENVLAHGTGGINIGATRIEIDPEDAAQIETQVKGYSRTRSIGGDGVYGGGEAYDRGEYSASAGRWPANVMLDATAGAILDADAGAPVSRFFYSGKASREEREAGLDRFAEVRRTDGRTSDRHVPNLRTTSRRNHHPTVKPIAVMRWMVRLITPPGGLVLDPFTGSGTTGIACDGVGVPFVGIELDPTYAAIAEARISHWRGPLFAYHDRAAEIPEIAAMAVHSEPSREGGQNGG